MNYPTNFENNPAFDSLFGFSSGEEEIEHMAVMYSLRIMHEVEKLCDAKAMKKKDLAVVLGVSAAFVTQLNHGDKLINPKLIARIEKHFGLRLQTAFVSVDKLPVQKPDTKSYPESKGPDLKVAEPGQTKLKKSKSK